MAQQIHACVPPNPGELCQLCVWGGGGRCLSTLEHSTATQILLHHPSQYYLEACCRTSEVEALHTALPIGQTPPPVIG